MKKIIFCSLLSLLFLSTSFAQYRTERTGYEGDYFSLEGALDLFKRSATLRDFERRINTEENWVNNLDLDYDGRIDYIRVEHRRQGNFHIVILQALLDDYAVQDVAVIEIEVLGRGEAILQIIGDEDLYGEEVVVEPIEGYTDGRSGYHPDYGDYVNVYYWEPVQYILGQQYQVYVSPYRWRSYPAWWNPWRPYSWSIFRPRVVVYVNHYHVVPRYQVIRVHNFYQPYRSYCPTVVQRANQVRIEHGRSPVHRPSPVGRGGERDGNYRGRDEVVERPGAATHPDAQRPGAPLSRERTESTTERGDVRSGTSRTYPGSRSAANTPETSRSTTPSRSTGQDPSLGSTRRPSSPEPGAQRSRTPQTEERSRSAAGSSGAIRPADRPETSRQSPPKPQPTYDQTRNRSTSPQVRQPSGSATDDRPRATGPSAGSKENVSGRPNSGSSASPGTHQPSRGQTARPETPSRSATTTRATAPERKPSASRRTAPAERSNE